ISLGIYPPDSGWVELLGGRNPLEVRYRVGYLPEERGLYAKMKVREQLAFLGAIRGLNPSEADRRAGQWLQRMGLSGREQSSTNELSKGMQQKVQFASAVLHDPEVVVLDEPFTGLDPVNTRLLKDLILEQSQAGTTVILSTHRMEQVEAMCDSICLIHRGETVLAGQLAEIKTSYGKSTALVEYEGAPGVLKDLPGVREVNDSGREARLRLEKDADSQALLRALLDRAQVRSFRLEEPHIEDIYIEKVGARSPAFESEGSEVLS
ncbi:MAG: ABC transporter ATP-binding protein, partial [Acidobacteriota bacterium]